jgi:hypothetical protein
MPARDSLNWRALHCVRTAYAPSAGTMVSPGSIHTGRNMDSHFIHWESPRPKAEPIASLTDFAGIPSPLDSPPSSAVRHFPCAPCIPWSKISQTPRPAESEEVVLRTGSKRSTAPLSQAGDRQPPRNIISSCSKFCGFTACLALFSAPQKDRGARAVSPRARRQCGGFRH